MYSTLNALRFNSILVAQNIQIKFIKVWSSHLHVCHPVVMTSVFCQDLRLSYEAFCGPLPQRGEVNWTGRWWRSWPAHRRGPATLCWQRWGVWSVPGARGAVSPCPSRWPSSGSACQGCRTRGRVDGCDLQGAQLHLRSRRYQKK